MKTGLFIFLLWGSLALAGTPISSQQFPAGDSIHVQFTSRGCFHDQMFEFDFQRAARVTAKVMQVERRWNEKQNREQVIRRVALGIVPTPSRRGRESKFLSSNQSSYPLEPTLTAHSRKNRRSLRRSSTLDVGLWTLAGSGLKLDYYPLGPGYV